MSHADSETSGWVVDYCLVVVSCCADSDVVWRETEVGLYSMSGGQLAESGGMLLHSRCYHFRFDIPNNATSYELRATGLRLRHYDTTTLGRLSPFHGTVTAVFSALWTNRTTACCVVHGYMPHLTSPSHLSTSYRGSVSSLPFELPPSLYGCRSCRRWCWPR